MPTFKPVEAMEEQNRFRVESIEVSLNSSVKGGFPKQVSKDCYNDIQASERTQHIEILEKGCLAGVIYVTFTRPRIPGVRNMVRHGNGESTRTIS